MKKMNCKICYLIQAYADEKAFKKLVFKLLEDNEAMIFVHLDAKSNLNNFLIKNNRVIFIDNREFVSWAGFSQGKLIMNLIDFAMSYKEKFDYYCFLSESDYPVYSGKKLKEKIINSSIVMLNCSLYQKDKIERYWFYDFGIKSKKLNKVLNKSLNFVSGLLYKLGILKKSSNVLIDNVKRDIYFSGPFWRYTYSQLFEINNIYKRNPSIEKYFKYSFASCELIVPTLIANADLEKNIIFTDVYRGLNNLSGLCYFKYTGSRVNILDENDYEDIINSGKPFIRKVNEQKSKSLLEKLENNEN